MRDSTYDSALTESAIRNVHFLLAQQVQTIDLMAAEGRDTSAARALLHRLMLLERGLRSQRNADVSLCGSACGALA